MPSFDDTVASLTLALEVESETPVPPRFSRGYARRFLAAGEIVHLVLRTEGWTLFDGHLVVTDRRVLHTREVFLPTVARRDLPASEVAGVELEQGMVLTRVRIRTRTGRDLRVTADGAEAARRFVDAQSRMITGPRR